MLLLYAEPPRHTEAAAELISYLGWRGAGEDRANPVAHQEEAGDGLGKREIEPREQERLRLREGARQGD